MKPTLPILTITLVLVFSAGSLASCTLAEPTPPSSPATSTATAEAVQPNSTQPIPTSPAALDTPAPTTTPALEDLLESLPPLEPSNLGQLTLLGTRPLDPDLTSQAFSGFDWSVDGRRIITCVREGSRTLYRVYDLEQGTKLSEAAVNSSACSDDDWQNRWLKFSRDGSMFLGLTSPPHFFDVDHPAGPAVFDSQTGEVLATLEVPPADYPGEMGVVERAAFSSRGTRLALSVYYPAQPASTEDANIEGGAWIEYRTGIHLYDVQTGAFWGTFQKLEHWEILDLAYSTEGEYLLTASYEAVQAWSVDGTLINQVDCPAAAITFSPTAEIAALACEPRIDDPYQLLWDPASGEENLLTGAPGNDFLKLTFSPDGRLLIGLSKSGQVSIWHGVSGELLYTLPENIGEAVEVHFSYGGRAVCLLTKDGRLLLFGVRP